MKPKIMLIDKILPHNIDKSSVLRNLKNVTISYKHAESNYAVHINKSGSNLEDTGQNNSTSNDLSFHVEKTSFMKTILENIKSPLPRPLAKPKKIVIDFSSPNIAKPFHAGHLRSTIIGNFIANINTYFDNKVTRLNYLGDWGTQFGLLQYGLKSKNINVKDLQNDPIRILYDVYVHANKLAATDSNVQEEARKFFSDIEQGRMSLENWKNIREVTVQELEKVYQRLGIQFDTYHWESDYNGGAIKPIMDLLEKKNIIKVDESGKKIANVNNRDVAVLKSDNSTLYLSRDIAALLDRYKKYEFDKMLYVVDNAQTDHFAAVFEIVKQIDQKCTEGCEHIKFGRLKGMSTRTGNVVFLNDILDEAKRKMHDKQASSKNTRTGAMNEETCDILGTSAVLINDLKQKRLKDYTFNWDRALQTEGDSAIKLQYLHCRLWSLEQNCGVSLPDTCEAECLSEEVIGDVIAELAKFENTLQKSLDEYEACILVNYLFRLARHVNRMFNEVRVKDVNSDLAAQRLLVFYCSRIVLKTALQILGIRPLKEM
ncbi:probable arginine--tRNA ligase, mitochondrial [Spodoptera frugiperda]|uniref:Probable arginine--tRNA ligase, mitochondrial n=1 Tax=Spodoptera frugiperda TaxID=7108 RepID=A0A9R0CVW5_SPOFR|nr:probable arginine--tRNA ligase, mitochondrial [Spodoptera frugiperda]